MSDEVAFEVRGIPAPGGSKKGFYVPKLKRVVITDDCKRSKPWQQLVNAAARDAHQGDPLEGPLSLHVEFVLPRPKAHFTSKGLRPTAPRNHTKKPDATKLLRSLEDALKGVVWADDSQVAEQIVRKVYGAAPGAFVRVARMADNGRVMDEPVLLTAAGSGELFEARPLTCCGRRTG